MSYTLHNWTGRLRGPRLRAGCGPRVRVRPARGRQAALPPTGNTGVTNYKHTEKILDNMIPMDMLYSDITMKPKEKKATAPRKSERSAVLLRLPPDLAEWYQVTAEKGGRSRTKLMEMWLRRLPQLVLEMEKDQSESREDPFTVIDSYGMPLVGELMRLGVLGDLMRDVWEYHQREGK